MEFDLNIVAALLTLIGYSLNDTVVVFDRIRENFAFATVYNLIAIPIALLGWATPMVAAIAMSSSSAIVTLNALRLSGGRKSHGRS